MSAFDEALLRQLGKFTKDLRQKAREMPVEGGSALSLIEFVEGSIRDAGYFPAFPCTVSVNEVAAHATIFDEDYYFQRGDVVKIDFGVVSQGHITDNAVTVEVGSDTYRTLLQANQEGLDAIMDAVAPGKTMSELGGIVASVAERHGLATIHNLCGHEIGFNNLHCGLNVPNYANGDSREVTADMELAIEPFFTTGSPKVKAVGNSNVLHLIRAKPVRDPIAKKVLDHIKTEYPDLPFSKRWLLDTFEKRKVLYALRVLKEQHIVHEYDALGSVDGSIISQFEDTVVFADGRKTIITREE
jgi:methionyl aminopeptidase